MNICPCEESGSIEFKDRLTALERIREKCPVIRELLIPDGNWEQFKRFELGKRDEALHASTLVIALLDGNLRKITRPIHAFLFEQDNLKSELVNQYRQDLQERWMFEDNEIARHQKAKSFSGRIVELQIAEWFQKQGWVITGLEALGCKTDIECVRPISRPSSVEVKFIGQRDEEFQQVVNSLAGRRAGGLGPSHVGCNYLMLRVYEAATQLKTANSRRIAAVVIDQSAYMFLDIPLEHNWIKWESPTFLDVGSDWKDFLTRERKRYPTVESDLAETITTLHELWIIIRGNGYQYYLQSHYLF
jgi:hypothetical protein